MPIVQIDESSTVEVNTVQGADGTHRIELTMTHLQARKGMKFLIDTPEAVVFADHFTAEATYCYNMNQASNQQEE